jgi:hypothetical protein
MTVDMTNNRVPYGLLTDEEKAALHEHEKAGGEFERYAPADLGGWCYTLPEWCDESIYRTLPLPEKTQDVIAWEKLPDWVEWVAREDDEHVWAFEYEPHLERGGWVHHEGYAIPFHDFPGIVQIGTCGWKDSKQRRPRG